MLETKLVSPYSVTPTHHLVPDKYFALKNSGNVEEILKRPGVLFGNSRLIYDGHHRVMLARDKKVDLPEYIITSQQDFIQLPREFWNHDLSPEKHSYEDVLKILERSSLADDEVFN